MIEARSESATAEEESMGKREKGSDRVEVDNGIRQRACGRGFC